MHGTNFNFLNLFFLPKFIFKKDILKSVAIKVYSLEAYITAVGKSDLFAQWYCAAWTVL